jgi:Xaa-Pro aminopeptidase
MKSKIQEAQKYLTEYGIDGWLLYDFAHSNPLALEFLNIPKDQHLSRRLFYWIPKKGEPIAIVHAIEPYVLDHLSPVIKKTYQRWQDLQGALKEVLNSSVSIAMEYSPLNALPYISKVDAGTLEIVKLCGVSVVSSAPFLQYFTAVLNEKQKASQKEAGKFLDTLAEETFFFLEECLNKKKKISEYQLQQWVLERFSEQGFMTQYPPTCAFGVHTADPHYSPQKEDSFLLKQGEPILLDFVAKKTTPESIYGDITRVGFAGSSIPSRYEHIFNLVKEAQQEAFKFIKGRFSKKENVKGFEVDAVCREMIEKEGYGEYFTHRTGHNLYTSVHGSGAHLDGFETFDDRPLIPNTCFTIEPGIYLPDLFGVRVEYDVLIHHDDSLEITSGIQEKIRQISC